MKIAINHIIERIKENPSIEEISDKLFQLGHEHEIQDNIINFEFTPNRGDCLSIKGITRDLGIFYTIKDDLEIYKDKIAPFSIDFENLSQEACPKISFLKLEVDDLPKKYTGKLKNYFDDLNLKRNNFFTDISNYLSYETGQPTHCYDAKKINKKITLKNIETESEFETLVNKKIFLSGKDTVFIHDNEIINLAGIMGGINTACSANTKTVLVECAYFNPEAIIGKSVKYDIQSEAAYKFERGVDPECHEDVLRRFIKIVSEHTDVKNISFEDNIYKNIPKKNRIVIDFNIINKIIGIKISEDEYFKYLTRLGFTINENFVDIPLYRSDIKTQNDLAEEIARIIGYDNIPASEIKIPKLSSTSNNIKESKMKSFLLDQGFYEVINSPFVKKRYSNSIKVDNPLDSNRQYLRINIIDSLVENLLFNERRQKDSIKLFEISDIYTSNNGIKKDRKIALIGSGRVGLNHKEFSMKINKKYIKNMFAKTFPIENFEFQSINRNKLDTKIQSEIVALEISFDDISDGILNYKNISKKPKDFVKYKSISELPSSFKDLSYSVNDDKTCKDLFDCIMNYKNKILRNVFVFDYYRNDKKNVIKIGFRFNFQSTDKTLTTYQIEDVLNDIISISQKLNGVEIPGYKINNDY